MFRYSKWLLKGYKQLKIIQIFHSYIIKELGFQRPLASSRTLTSPVRDNIQQFKCNNSILWRLHSAKSQILLFICAGCSASSLSGCPPLTIQRMPSEDWSDCTDLISLWLILIFLGPVVQSVVSLTSSLRVISLTVLAYSMYNILIFFAEKMWVAFALQKLLTFFQQKISAYLRITRCRF